MTITFTVSGTSGTPYETKVDINPRGNGIEWEKYIDSTNTTKKKVYIPIIDGLQLGVVYNGETSRVSILVDPITNDQINLSENDAQRVYNYIGQLIDQWHPDALESGNAHPDLLAARQRHAEMAGTASLVTGGGGGGSSSNNRKSRKSRKSRKARKVRKSRKARK
jgi:hypothetical protein